MSRIGVVVVESSAQERAHLVRTLERDGDIAVVGEAGDALEAIRVVQDVRPAVVTLDLQLPGGGGLRVIEELMAFAPAPILVLSGSIAGRDSGEAVEALVAGAVDVLPKPVTWSADDEEALRAHVRLVSGVAVVRRARRSRPARGEKATKPGPATPIVAVGASTGGPAALAEILGGLGGVDACVLVVQHLHTDFVGGLVAWMARASPLPVELARDGARLQRGVAYIAPGGTHLRVNGDDELELDPKPETLHRPSIDVLFNSVAERTGGQSVGVLLTGMGDDGAAGLLALRRRGAVTIVQDEETSVVYGMPRAAQRLGAAGQVLPVAQIAGAIKRAL